jgi:hypothetical protein
MLLLVADWERVPSRRKRLQNLQNLLATYHSSGSGMRGVERIVTGRVSRGTGERAPRLSAMTTRRAAHESRDRRTRSRKNILWKHYWTRPFPPL